MLSFYCTHRTTIDVQGERTDFVQSSFCVFYKQPVSHSSVRQCWPVHEANWGSCLRVQIGGGGYLWPSAHFYRSSLCSSQSLDWKRGAEVWGRVEGERTPTPFSSPRRWRSRDWPVNRYGGGGSAFNMLLQRPRGLRPAKGISRALNSNQCNKAKSNCVD